MKIGILTYHSVYNFGANLQAVSTYGYFKKHGYDVIIINWIPEDLESYYKKITPDFQQNAHNEFMFKNTDMTDLCRTNQDVAIIIEKYNITHVVIGSDAVAQHHPFFSRIVIPSKKVISFTKPLSDRLFPNPFWGSFLDYLNKPVKIAMMSASGQTTKIKTIFGSTKLKMCSAVEKFSYISVRDNHTNKLIKHITNNKINPNITPDPVFNFNKNFIGKMKSKEEILEQFNLPENYVLLSFKDNNTVTQSWIDDLCKYFNSIKIECVALPFPSGIKFDNNLQHKINLPLDPLDWYLLIKYSRGYIGHNMHPIIVSLHNAVPFYSFDHYVKRKNIFFVNDEASKIYHIVNKSKLNTNRSSVLYGVTKTPSPLHVYNTIVNFDHNKCKDFSIKQSAEYSIMMENILKKFS